MHHHRIDRGLLEQHDVARERPRGTESFFGHLKFNDTGQNVYKPMSVIQVQNGKAVTVWPTDSAEAKMIWPGTKQ